MHLFFVQFVNHLLQIHPPTHPTTHALKQFIVATTDRNTYQPNEPVNTQTVSLQKLQRFLLRNHLNTIETSTNHPRYALHSSLINLYTTTFTMYRLSIKQNLGLNQKPADQIEVVGDSKSCPTSTDIHTRKLRKISHVMQVLMLKQAK